MASEQAVRILERHGLIVYPGQVVDASATAKVLSQLEEELAHADKVLAQYEERTFIPVIGEIGDGVAITWFDAEAVDIL